MRKRLYIFRRITGILLPLSFLAIGIFLVALGAEQNDAFVIFMGVFFALGGLLGGGFEIREVLFSRKMYNKYLQEERLKLGLIDELPEEDEYEEEYKEEDEEEDCEPESVENQYDADSSKEYCPNCGNFSVSNGRCELCREKVTE